MLRSSYIYIALTVLIFCSLPARAADSIHTLNLDARGLALGQGAAALGGDYAASGNPADLGGVTTVALAVSQARLAYDQVAYQARVWFPAGGGLAFHFSQLITQNASYERLLTLPDGTPVIDPVTNQQAVEIAYDTRIDSLFGLAYGLPVAGGWALGVELDAVHMQVGQDFAWGFDGTAGLGGPVAPGWSAGLIASDLNRQFRAWHAPYREETGSARIEAGLAWTWDEAALTMAGAYRRRLDGDDPGSGHLGLEYFGWRPLVLRAGWDRDHANVGAGVRWGPVTVAYAAVIGGALYDANRITLKVEW